KPPGSARRSHNEKALAVPTMTLWLRPRAARYRLEEPYEFDWQTLIITLPRAPDRFSATGATDRGPGHFDQAAQKAAVGQIGPFHSPTCSSALFAKVVSTISSYLGVLPSLMLPTLVMRSAVKFTRSGLSPLLASQMHSLIMKSKLSDRIFSG